MAKRILVALALLWLAGCNTTTTAATPPPPVFLKVAGSTSAGPLLTELATAYMQQNPHVTIDVQGGGSQLGQRLAESGQIEVGLVSGPTRQPAEELRRVPLALDGVAIITHPQNSIAGLSMLELQQIFSGRLSNWQAVDGPNVEIQVISREDGSGTRAVFEQTVMNGETVTPNAIVLPNSRAVAGFVTANPNAIAYVSHGVAAQNTVHTVPIEGVLPSPTSLNDASYPIIRELALLVAAPAPPEVTRFVAFAQSPAGRQIVNRQWGRPR